MVGARHIELLGNLAAGGLRPCYSLGHTFLRTGNDCLAGAIEIGNIHVTFLRQLNDVFIRAADHGGHSAFRGVACFLHKRAALLDKAEAFFKRIGPGSGMSREFPQGKAGGSHGIQGGNELLQDGQAGKAMYVEGRLTVAGTRQFFAGAFKHDGRKGFSKRLVRLFNQGFGDGILVIQIFAHAYFLGTLSGKQ